MFFMMKNIVCLYCSFNLYLVLKILLQILLGGFLI